MNGAYLQNYRPGHFTLSIVSVEPVLGLWKYREFSCKRENDEDDPRSNAPEVGLDMLVTMPIKQTECHPLMRSDES